MFDIFGSVKGLVKLDTICIDNNIFRLHYKVSLSKQKPAYQLLTFVVDESYFS